MTLTRTSFGLQNLHLFLGVDMVLYVEGGDSISMPEVLSGKFSEVTHDIQFWETVCGTFSNMRFAVRSVGSKSTILEIHQKVLKDGITRVVLAIDADYSIVFGEIEPDAYIMTTWGYSWESDVCQPDALGPLIPLLAPVSNNDSRLNQAKTAFVEALTSDLNYLVNAEIELWQFGIMLFERVNWQRHILRGERPTLDVEGLKQSYERKMEALPTRVRKELKLSEVDVERYFFGHLRADLFYLTICKWLRTHKLKCNIPKDTVFSAAIRAFKDSILHDSTSAIAKHYKDEFSRLKLLTP